MKSNFKYCALALAVTTILTGCDDDNKISNDNNGNPYVVPIASDISISGDNFVNSTLTGEYKYLDPNYVPRPEGESVYSWRVDNADNDLTNDVEKGQERSYLLTDNELDEKIYFCVKPKAKGTSNTTGEEKCSTSLLIKSGNGNKPEATNAAIDNTAPTVGDTLTGSYDYSDQESDPEGNSTFRWTQDGNNIPGQTNTTLTLTNQQEGLPIEFCVTPVSTNPDNIDNSPLIGDPVCSQPSDSVAPLAGSAPTATTPTITGDHTVGSVLTADYTYADADSDLESNSQLQWQRDGVDISGATNKTYTLVAADKTPAVITFIVTPNAGTGTPTTGTPMTSAPINDVTDPVGPVPTITLNAIGKSGSSLAKVGETLTGSYNFTASPTGSADDSTAMWKADGAKISSITCSTSSSCDLTLAAEHYGKDLTYCVTPKAVDSPAGTEECSNVEQAYGIALSGTLEFGKTLDLAVYGYSNPTIEWKVDISNISGPAGDTNKTVRNTVTTGDAARSFLIGDEVFKKIIDVDNTLDLDVSIGNNNGVIDDADWAQASLNGDVTMDSGSADTNTINAAHYVGKDVEVTVTFTEAGEAPITFTASQVAEVTGGVYYDKADASKRAIEPVRELEFGTLVYHRPITVAEATLKAAAEFGATVPVPRYSKVSAGIEWAVYRAVRDPADPDPSEYPAVDSCINLYDDVVKDLWHLPASRYDGSYIPNGYAAQGNNPPLADADKAYALIKFAGAINKSDNSAKSGLLGTYIDRTTPNAKLNYLISPTTGRVLNGDTGSTAHWSATTDGTGKTNSVLFYEAGGSGNNSSTNGRFVSCVRAK